MRKTWIAFVSLGLAGCVGTLYSYEIEIAQKACETNLGVHRIERGPRGIAVYCNNGKYIYPATQK